MRISSLQWIVGTFIAALGALMLVSPHQFAAAAYAPLQAQLNWFGPGFLLSGACLLAVATPGPRLRYVVLAHLWAGAMLVYMAAGFVLSGSWTGTSNYGVLGIGTACAPLLARVPTRRHLHTRPDAFLFLIGLAAAFSGLVVLALPTQFTATVYDPVRPNLLWYGVAFLASGIILCLATFGILTPPGLRRWSPVLVAVVFSLFGFTVAAPNRAWTVIVYYGGFGAALVVLAWLGPHLRRLDAGSLRTRVALVLAAAAAGPVLALAPVYSHEEEVQAVAQHFARQQALAGALAQAVADFVSLHQAGVTLLATQPGLLALSPDAQRLLLQRSKAAYADVNAFGIVAANGEPIARSDDRQGTSWIGDRLFEDARRTGRASLDVRISPVIHLPVFSIGVPILDGQNQFNGMVAASVETSRVADFLTRNDPGDGAQIYLVDATGRVIAHPDPELVANYADLSQSPSVVALMHDPAATGSSRVAGPLGEVLASFAHVPDLGWGVVVERSTAAVLAPTRAKLDLLFGGLLVLIGAAAGFGVVAARWLSRPLVTLGTAVDGLAAGDDSAPLPAGGLTEIAGLATAFGTMRARVVGRTADLVAANRELAALYRVGQTITAPLLLDVVLNTIARCTAEVLETDSSAILLIDEPTQTLSIQGAYGISERAVRDTRDRVGESIAGRVAQTGQPLIANDLPNNPLFVNPAAVDDGLLAIASVPLIVGDKTIGTLDVHSKTDRFAFDDRHIHTLRMLASQAAIAIENARLFQEVQLARDELEARVQLRTTELRGANEQIRELNGDLELRVIERTAALEAANSELEAFSYSVSHDLRAPLRVINGFAQILLEDHAAVLVPEAQDFLRLIGQNSVRMGVLIEDLLRFSRLTRQGLRKDRVLVADLVRDVLRELAPEQAGRQVEIAVGELLPCHGDAALLKQVFVNLLGNALKFTRNRAVGHVEIGCLQANGEVVYFVKDDGAGFDMRYAEKLFGVFQRMHRAEDFEGTGVGLAIVQRIVQRHGGRIWADGAPDQGATFSFTLASAQSDGLEWSADAA